jgi:hypothetical protein
MMVVVEEECVTGLASGYAATNPRLLWGRGTAVARMVVGAGWLEVAVTAGRWGPGAAQVHVARLAFMQRLKAFF